MCVWRVRQIFVIYWVEPCCLNGSDGKWVVLLITLAFRSLHYLLFCTTLATLLAFMLENSQNLNYPRDRYSVEGHLFSLSRGSNSSFLVELHEL